MRANLRDRVGLAAGDHVGLAYTTLAPVDRDGKVPDESKDQWLRNLANTAIAPDYRAHVDAWLASFAHTSARLFTLTLTSRLLIGHGNTSGTDVGLTVHHTWGVPVVPGSALKGTLAHHVATTYGAEPFRDLDMNQLGKVASSLAMAFAATRSAIERVRGA